ncbi:apoptosis-inducing factor 1, mitochondrial isoform X2 [Adelges cooleyi]|uniref:apoptosis-inducing factor 1, mitochondrial isoform X2 n=1 Tax=Adelges cooleyi TaxID=133065 RepID=UPI0021801494|nr:apoptosis-inducing factor 1, mitochondrial isoform X2 [Adelges cooleyi]
MLSKLRLIKPPVPASYRLITAWESSIRKYSDQKNGGGKSNKSKPSPLIQVVKPIKKKLSKKVKNNCLPAALPIKEIINTECKEKPLKACVTTNNTQGYSTNNKYRNLLLLGGTLVLAGGLYSVWSSDSKRSNLDDKDLKKTIAKKEKKSRKTIQIPPSSKSIPDDVQYLLIGGGTASFSAFRAIKSADPTARVLVVSAEGYLPYMRPPLSKELWYNDDPETAKSLNFHQWNGTTRSLFYEPEPFYTPVEELNTAKNGGISLARGWEVKSIDASNKMVTLQDGKQIKYQKCLIATGSVPKTLKIYDDAPQEVKNKFSVFRSIVDYEDLWDDLTHAKSVAIIGGGFLGSELAASLATKGKKNGVKVYQIFKENGNMAKVLPKYLSQWTTEKVMFEGVEVVSNTEVEACNLESDGKQVNLILNNGKKITVDHVIMAVGAKPNTELAVNAGLEIDPHLGGYLVNSELKARTDLYIAGDCASFYDKQLGRRRVEHHDHAVISGRLAGENMAGASKIYSHQPMFWSDIGPSVGYEAIGIINSSLPTVGVFATPKDVASPTSEVEQNVSSPKKESEHQNTVFNPTDYSKGVVFYLQNDVVVGIVLWNLFNRMSTARQVLASDRCYRDLNEVAKLFNIHGEASSSS